MLSDEVYDRLRPNSVKQTGSRLPRLGLAVVLGVCVIWADATIESQTPQSFVRLSSLATPGATLREVIRQQRVEITSLGLLSDPQRSTVLQLDLFRDLSLRVVRERIERTAHGISWVGVVDGYRPSNALFVVVGDHLVGHIYLPFGFFVIERQANRSFLVKQIDQREFDRGSEPVISPQAVSAAERDTERTGSADDGSVIDLLIAYTQDVPGGFSSGEALTAAIDMAVASTNRALDVSKVRTRLRLVHTTQVQYEETGDSDIDLSRLRSSSDGFVDVLHSLRDEYAADLVALVTERMDRHCGIAFLGFPASTASAGFSVTKRVCLTGSTFSHEIGHNLGAQHDWYDDATAGAYSYAHGFVDVERRFRDLMSQSGHCVDTNTECVTLLTYSNPLVTHYGTPVGVPVGTSTACTTKNLSNPPCDADAAQAIGYMAPRVARYRDSRLALSARRLLPDESFRSSSGRYRLTYQSDGDLVLYDEQMRTRLWTANTAGTAPGQTLLQTDGNFVVYDSAGVNRWSSGTSGNPNAYLAVQDDGNLVIYGSDGQPIWTRTP